ncbi:MAG: tyrosine-type recombinase/integrase [Thermodesulfobacteriota bacterium]
MVVKTLYGCGLRLFECMKLRVNNFNFDAGVLTIHDGKGQKDRTVPLPQKILPELKDQLNRVIDLHEEDMAAGYAGVFLGSSFGKEIQERFQRARLAVVFSGKNPDLC